MAWFDCLKAAETAFSFEAMHAVSDNGTQAWQEEARFRFREKPDGSNEVMQLVDTLWSFDGSASITSGLYDVACSLQWSTYTVYIIAREAPYSKHGHCYNTYSNERILHEWMSDWCIVAVPGVNSNRSGSLSHYYLRRWWCWLLWLLLS